MEDSKKEEKAQIAYQKYKEVNETLELQKLIGANQVALARIEAEKLQQLKAMELEETKVKAEESSKVKEKQIAYEKELESMKLAQEKELMMV
ncbi:MAG: hypothetical protein ACP5D3_04100, partial [Sulfurovum sp.]